MPVVLVTGGSAGIGQAVAIRLAEAGWNVVLTYRSRRSEAMRTVGLIVAAGGNAVALPLDVTDIDSFPRFVELLTSTIRDDLRGDHVDALINNAGIGGGSAFPDVTQAEFDRFHVALVKGPYFLTQCLLPLLADGAAIVNTGSTSALPTGTEANYSAYAAQKGALHTLTRCWAKELAPRRIRVNAVAPGSTRTRIADDGFTKLPDHVLAELADSVALGRIGEPDDVAATIAFLAGADSRWVTGQVLECSGGQGL